MCNVLKVSRSRYYKEIKGKPDESELTKEVIEIFDASRKTYGTRRIKVELAKRGQTVSRRRIGRIMRENGLISKYTRAKFKPVKDKCNEDEQKNLVNRQFDSQPPMRVVVSDLTYVRVGKIWGYICILLDLYNREIIGFSSGRNKDANLVKSAFYSVKSSLSNIEIFHADRGREFRNEVIDDIISVFDIKRSLSKKACPYDNAVAEATFKSFKTEFINDSNFESLQQLQLQLFDYVNWFNNHRLHSSLNYLSPSLFKAQNHLPYYFSLQNC